MWEKASEAERWGCVWAAGEVEQRPRWRVAAQSTVRGRRRGGAARRLGGANEQTSPLTPGWRDVGLEIGRCGARSRWPSRFDGMADGAQDVAQDGPCAATGALEWVLAGEAFGQDIPRLSGLGLGLGAGIR